MATATDELGDYTIEDDSNGNYTIKDPNGNVIFQWDNSAGEWTLNTNALTGLDLLALVDAASDPTANGEATLNGSDVKVHSGGSVRNLSNIGSGGLTQVATGTVTASGGSSPAVNTTLTNVSTDQLLDYGFWVYVDSDPAFNADYAFNFDYSHSWDDTNSELDIDLTVNWDTDPGSGNDVTLRWEVHQ